MIQDGANSPTITSAIQSALSVAQFLLYNSSVRRRAESTGTYHSKTRETPLPIYVVLTVHARTRKHDLIDTLFDLGLSFSYDRVMEISMAINNRVCEQYKQDGVVCPPNLHQGLLTMGAVDILIITPAQQQHRVLSMVLECRSFNIPARRAKVKIVESIKSLRNQILQRSSWSYQNRTLLCVH